MNKPKLFDCVAMKHEAQERLYNKLNPTSPQDYFEKLTKLSKQSKLWQELQTKSNPARSR